VRFRERLLTRIRLMMGDAARERADSEDFLQGVFVEILQQQDRRPAPPDDDHFLRWATRIARNNIRDDVRRRREQAIVDSTQSGELPLLLHGVGRSPDGEAELRDEIERLIAVLERMPERCQRVIELRHFDGKRFAEIGDLLGCTEGAARALHTRALAELADELRTGE
jgi:RNA polymerase sigma-70 factor (ECF subfamily)